MGLRVEQSQPPHPADAVFSSGATRRHCLYVGELERFVDNWVPVSQTVYIERKDHHGV